MKTILTMITSVVLASCASTGLSSSARPYPLETCIVTDNKLGSMGTPVSLDHEGQEIKLCCRPCVAKFKANPERYLSKI